MENQKTIRIGAVVKAACDIIKDADDHSPEAILAFKGDKLTIEALSSRVSSFDYIVSGFNGNPNFHVKRSELN